MLPELTKIVAMRRRLGVSQKRLASITDVSQSLISKVESGTVVPAYDKAKTMFDALEHLELESAGSVRPGRALPMLEVVRRCKGRIGIVDTTFSRVDLGSIAVAEIRRLAPGAKVKRYTVPGIRDTPLACKILIEKGKCNMVISTAMVSRAGAEKRVEDQSVMGIMLVQLLTNTHVICAFFDEKEVQDKNKLYSMVADRTRKHVLNALRLLSAPEDLTVYAGLGLRQGSRDVGPLRS
jgi:riboflavin synthase